MVCKSGGAPKDWRVIPCDFQGLETHVHIHSWSSIRHNKTGLSVAYHMIGRVLDLSLKIKHYQAPLQYALLVYDHHNSTWVLVIAPSKQDCTIFRRTNQMIMQGLSFHNYQ
jgi:hypothetical protein